MEIKEWVWEKASNALEVHKLLCLSDLNAPGFSPVRDFSKTERYVSKKLVTVLRKKGALIASFTLTKLPSRDLKLTHFPRKLNPHYMQWLIVHPEFLNSNQLIGIRCVRQAIKEAKKANADAVRAEVALHIPYVLDLLLALGFKKHGPNRGTVNGEYLSLQLSL